MTLLACLVAIYALALLSVPGMRAPFLRDRFVSVPLAVYGHLAGGAVALAIGPFQFLDRLRRRFLPLHRWFGRVYLGAVLLAGLGGLALAVGAQGGAPARTGFGLLALLWLSTAGMAYLSIRGGHVAAHRRWMIRNYGLTLAAVTLRIYLPLSQAAGIPFGIAYPIISWLCWLPNLGLAEWWLRTPPRVTTQLLARE